MITWENYEEYMMMHADGELKAAEEQELMAFLDAHPELKKELALYEKVKLVPDTAIVFEDKKSLLRPEGGKRVIAFPKWQRYSIAAGVAAILFISFFKFNNAGKEIAITATDTTKTSVTVPGNKTTPQPQNNIAAIAKDDTGTKAPVAVKSNDVAAVLPAKNTGTKLVHTKHQPVIQYHQDHEPVAMVNDPLSRMNPGTIKELPYNSIAAATPVVTEVPTLPAIENTNEQKRSFFEKLPIDDLKKQGMENVATAFANGFDKISTIRQGIEESTVTVKIERRRLVISF